MSRLRKRSIRFAPHVDQFLKRVTIRARPDRKIYGTVSAGLFGSRPWNISSHIGLSLTRPIKSSREGRQRRPGIFQRETFFLTDLPLNFRGRGLVLRTATSRPLQLI